MDNTCRDDDKPATEPKKDAFDGSWEKRVSSLSKPVVTAEAQHREERVHSILLF